MSVVFDLTGLILPAGSNAYSLNVNCGLNISTIPDLDLLNYSHKAITELYEVPRSTAINLFLKD